MSIEQPISDRLCILVALLALAGCEQTSKTSADTQVKAATDMSYFKDTKGICYASLSSWSHGGYRIVSITSVPCDKAGL